MPANVSFILWAASLLAYSDAPECRDIAASVLRHHRLFEKGRKLKRGRAEMFAKFAMERARSIEQADAWTAAK